MQTKNEGLLFYIKIYFKIIIQDMKSKMSYRMDFIVSTMGILLTNIAGALSFSIIFQNFSSLNGWSYYEILFFYGFSLIALTPLQCCFDNNWILADKLYTGDFIKYYYKPINMFFYFESESFDLKGMGQFFFGLFTVLYTWKKLDVSTSTITILFFVVNVISASLVNIAIMTFTSAIGFWVINSSYAMTLAWKLKDYARYPVSIFKNPFHIIFTFIFPIAFTSYYPSMIVLRDEVPWLAYSTPAIGIVTFYLSYKVWMYGATKYSGTGN